MKKLLIASTLCFFSSIGFADNIGENFEKGGFILKGFGYFSSNEEYKWSSSTAGISLLVADGLSLGFDVKSYYDSSKISDDFRSELDLGTSIDYSFGYDPNNETGLV